MAEQRQPHVEQDLGRHARVSEAAHDVEGKAGDGEARERDDDPHERAGIAAEQGAVDQDPRQVGE